MRILREIQRQRACIVFRTFYLIPMPHSIYIKNQRNCLYIYIYKSIAKPQNNQQYNLKCYVRTVYVNEAGRWNIRWGRDRILEWQRSSSICLPVWLLQNHIYLVVKHMSEQRKHRASLICPSNSCLGERGGASRWGRGSINGVASRCLLNWKKVCHAEC